LGNITQVGYTWDSTYIDPREGLQFS